MSHEAKAIFLQQGKVFGNELIEEREVVLMMCQGDQERTNHLQDEGVWLTCQRVWLTLTNN